MEELDLGDLACRHLIDVEKEVGTAGSEPQARVPDLCSAPGGRKCRQARARHQDQIARLGPLRLGEHPASNPETQIGKMEKGHGGVMFDREISIGDAHKYLARNPDKLAH
jgi:hypothetical protein